MRPSPAGYAAESSARRGGGSGGGAPAPRRPTADWPGEPGHVQPLLRKLFAGHRDLDAYICGLKEMVDDVRRILKEEFGLDRRQIHYEKYD